LKVLPPGRGQVFISPEVNLAGLPLIRRVLLPKGRN
jgi:hypothetical protein